MANPIYDQKFSISFCDCKEIYQTVRGNTIQEKLGLDSKLGIEAIKHVLFCYWSLRNTTLTEYTGIIMEVISLRYETLVTHLHFGRGDNHSLKWTMNTSYTHTPSPKAYKAGGGVVWKESAALPEQ